MIDLQQFCWTGEDREYLQQPFSRGAFTYATNGHILVRVPRRKSTKEHDKAPKAEELFERHLKGEFSPAPAFEIPDFEGNEYTCEDCGHMGTTKEEAVATVRGTLFNINYIRQLYALPGLQLPAIADKEDPLPFKFDGGDGLLMPMRRSFDNSKHYGEVFAAAVSP